MKAFKLILSQLTIISLVSSQKLAEQKIESYDKCQIDADCKANAFCFGNDDVSKGKCKCIDGYELYRNRTYYECLAAVRLGDACERDFQCQVKAGPMALCNTDKICECNENAHDYQDGKCYLNVKLTGVCLSDENCKLADGRYGFCTDGHCDCHVAERPSLDLTTCLPSRNLGDPCESDNECALIIPNAVCAGVCKCGSGYTISRDELNCLPAATTFGDSCIEDAQCSKYLRQSVCNQGKCGCLSGYHGYGVRCVRTSRAGEECYENAQCIFDKKLEGYVSCKGGLCACLLGESADSYGCVLDDNNNESSMEKPLIIFLLAALSFLLIT